MAKFLRRFFLFFFSILACLFLVSLLMPVAAFAHTMQSFTAKSSNVSSHMGVLPAATPTPITTTVPVTPTATPVAIPTPAPTATPTAVPTVAPTPTEVPTTPPATATPTAVPSPTPTMVPTPGPTPTPTPGGNTNATGAHTALNALIFTMGGAGVLLVIVGVILYFVYSRSI